MSEERDMPEQGHGHYDDSYFDWQASIGEFAGWASLATFSHYIDSHCRVLDFGCGGGFLLRNLTCSKRVGVEINPAAAATARTNGLEIFTSVDEVPDAYVDVVITNNALEHTLRPFDELRGLFRALEAGGRIIAVVPCDSVSFAYRPNDINRHLYSWSPMNMGNLLAEVGFSVIESKPYMHKWPPKYEMIARVGGKRLFDAACRVYGRLERSWSQVRVVATKPLA